MSVICKGPTVIICPASGPLNSLGGPESMLLLIMVELFFVHFNDFVTCIDRYILQKLHCCGGACMLLFRSLYSNLALYMQVTYREIFSENFFRVPIQKTSSLQYIWRLHGFIYPVSCFYLMKLFQCTSAWSSC